jgi:hypothetical protein
MQPPLAGALVAVALAVHVELLVRLRGVDARLPPWWFGYARDGANLSAALMLWGAYRLLGFASPVALLAAMLTTLATYLLDWLLARGLKLGRVRLAITVPIAAWLGLLVLAPGAIARVLGGLILAVQPIP